MFTDSERICELMEEIGYRLCDTADNADMIVLNTCHIREKAAEKLYSDLGRYKIMRHKKQEQGGDMLVVVAGCVAQAQGDEMMKRAPVIDIIVGPQTYHNLPKMINNLKQNGQHNNNNIAKDTKSNILTKTKKRKLIDVSFPVEEKFDNLSTNRNVENVTAFLTIQEGCDKFCTFCVVPYTRGAEFSRPALDIVEEAKLLVSKGVKEITLLGQNVNAYHGDAIVKNINNDKTSWGLARLIHELADIDGLERIRYTTSHPKDMDKQLIKAHGEVSKLMPYLHLPVQSGSDVILEAMNRQHTSSDYLKIIDDLKNHCPDIALTSDFIIGFPGETDQDFIDTLKLIRKVEYAASYSFKYSERPGTPASTKTEQVPEKVKSERLQTLQQLLNEQQLSFNMQKKDKILPVLFEKQGRHDGQITGRSSYLQPVHVELNSLVGIDKDNLIGKIFNVKIKKVEGHSLLGDIVSNVSSKEDFNTMQDTKLAYA